MNTEKVESKIHDFLNQKLEETGVEGYLVGVSGGIDSATTLKLTLDAVGVEKVSAWIMPGGPSKEQNMADAKQLCEELGVEHHEANVEPVVKEFQNMVDFQPEKEALGNTRARARMTLQYMDSNQNNKMVLGTGNRSEYLLGYFTKHGDGAADALPLKELYKTDVRKLAKHIGLDDKFIEKQPSAGLWEGQTDEEEIGENYETVDRILKALVDQELTVEEASKQTGIEEERIENIQRLHKESEHKRNPADFPEL